MSEKKGVMSWYFGTNLLLRILVGLILGAIVGIIFQHNATLIAFFDPFGSLFVRLLQMIVQPVIVFTLIVGTSSIAPSRLGKVGVKIILFYLLTSLFAIILGLVFGNVFAPGSGMVIEGVAGAAGKELNQPSLIPTLLAIVPTNPFNAIANGQVLPTIFFSICFGISLAFARESVEERVKSSADIVYRFFEGCAEVIFKVVGWVMQYAPIGVFALIFVVFSKQGSQAFGPLASVTVTVYLALICQLLLVYGTILFIAGISPVKFFKKVRSPMLTAFVTRSSGGTLPISMDVAENQMGISRGVYGFTLPLGATINMDGTTIYLGVCAMFIANILGTPLDFSQQAVVVLTAVLASIGTAGVPGAGAIMLLMVLESIGLKVEAGSAVAAAYAMVFGIDALLDMGRTSMNVVGDMTGACVVSKSENEMDMKAWES